MSSTNLGTRMVQLCSSLQRPAGKRPRDAVARKLGGDITKEERDRQYSRTDRQKGCAQVRGHCARQVLPGCHSTSAWALRARQVLPGHRCQGPPALGHWPSSTSYAPRPAAMLMQTHTGSMTMLWMSSTVTETLSPGITISTSSVNKAAGVRKSTAYCDGLLAIPFSFFSFFDSPSHATINAAPITERTQF